MNQTEALTFLRSSVARISRDEKLVLAAFLSLETTIENSFPVFQEKEIFREDLREAFKLSNEFPRITKIAFAIELLQHELSQAEEGDIPFDGDCEEGMYFCSECNRETMHELQPQININYETASQEEIAQAEKKENCIWICIKCTERKERQRLEEIEGDGGIDAYGEITLAWDEEDDSGLSILVEEDDDYFDPYYDEEPIVSIEPVADSSCKGQNSLCDYIPGYGIEVTQEDLLAVLEKVQLWPRAKLRTVLRELGDRLGKEAITDLLS